MKRRNWICKIVALSTVASVVLTGCDAGAFGGNAFNEETLQKIQNIGNNVNTISGYFSKEATKDISESIANTAETAEALTDAYNEKMASVEEAVVEEAANLDAESNAADGSSTDDMDGDELLARIQENVIQELIDYEGLGKDIIIAALAKRDIGMKHIKEGLNKFESSISNATDDMKADAVTDKAFSGLKEAMEGVQELSEGTQLAVDQMSSLAKKITDITDIMGIESKELDELNKLIDEAKAVQIDKITATQIDELNTYLDYISTNIPKNVSIADAEGVVSKAFKDSKPEDVKIQIEIEIGEDPTEYIKDKIEEIEDSLEQANEALNYVQDVYDTCEKTVDDVVEQVKSAKLEEYGFNEVVSVLQSYESVVREGFEISRKDIRMVRDYIDKATQVIKNQTSVWW